ncbi:MAG: hypothetical protein R2825_23200 [Saprospiraceae bacterium]
MDSLINNAIRQMEDAKFFLNRVSATSYCFPLPVFSGSTIGQHTRHFIEFYLCLLDCMKHENKILNYDDRQRDRQIESDPKYALKIIDKIMGQLTLFSKNVKLHIKSFNYISGSSSIIDTSMKRELLYNIEHTTHHFAMIKIGLNIVAPCLGLPEHFGVAASTIHNRKVQVGHSAAGE